MRGCRRRRRRKGRAGRRSRGRRQLDDERRALADDTPRGDAPPMCLDDRLRDVQPEPGARNLAIDRTLRPEEALEEALTLAFGEADPAILDLDRDLAVPAVDREVDAPRVRAEFDRIRDEVVDHLGEPAAVAAHGGVAAREPQPKLDVRADGLRLRGRDTLGDELRDVDRLLLDVEAPALEAGDEEEVVDE